MKETIDIREQHLMRQLNLGTTAVVDEQGSNDLLDVLLASSSFERHICLRPPSSLDHAQVAVIVLGAAAIRARYIDRRS